MSTAESKSPQPSGQVTRLLAEWREGDSDAVDRLLPLVYDELRGLARRYLYAERTDHTLQPTALVHEAYLRLVGNHPDLRDRVHFFGVASRLMRQVLVDHARSHSAAKRGGGMIREDLDADHLSAQERAADLLALDEALSELAEIDARKARIIELRYFGGLTLDEAAQLLGISSATVNNESRFARVWLQSRLSGT